MGPAATAASTTGNDEPPCAAEAVGWDGLLKRPIPDVRGAVLEIPRQSTPEAAGTDAGACDRGEAGEPVWAVQSRSQEWWECKGVFARRVIR